MFVEWSSHHLVFFFKSMDYNKREKKRENAGECYMHCLEKTLINCILTLHLMYFKSSPQFQN